jgi:hypothetical protein
VSRLLVALDEALDNCDSAHTLPNTTAAAPRLLAALEAIVKTCRRRDTDGMRGGVYWDEDAITDAVAAIRAAKGE